MRIYFYKVDRMYGGADFVLYDQANNSFCHGNTRSTTVDTLYVDLRVEVRTLKELRRIQDQLSIFELSTDQGRK